MTNSSVYYHFLEARRRPPTGKDDFSAWLMECGEEYRPYVDALSAIDFYFNSLGYLRREIARVLAVREGGEMSKLLSSYEGVVGSAVLRQLRQLGEKLAGTRIVHVNSTREGGGVAEILEWMVPLMNDLGLQASWEVIHGDPRFFEITKSVHNGLQGFQRSRFPGRTGRSSRT